MLWRSSAFLLSDFLILRQPWLILLWSTFFLVYRLYQFYKLYIQRVGFVRKHFSLYIFCYRISKEENCVPIRVNKQGKKLPKEYKSRFQNLNILREFWTYQILTKKRVTRNVNFCCALWSLKIQGTLFDLQRLLRSNFLSLKICIFIILSCIQSFDKINFR